MVIPFPIWLLFNPLFAGAPLSTRLFLRVRSIMTHYDDIAAELPVEGRLLDLGSGHGMLAFALSIGDPRREVIAIDHDPERVRMAERAALQLPPRSRPRFEAGDLREKLASFASRSVQGIAMLDVLHYFDLATQELLIRDAARVLKPGGTLLMRDVDADAGTRFRANRLYERMATGVGFTKSTAQTLHFRGKREWTDVLQRLGFTVRSMRSGVPFFADVLFIGKKGA